MSFYSSYFNILKKLKIKLIYILLLTGTLTAQPTIEFGENYHIIPENNIDQKFPNGAFDSNDVLHLVWVNDNNSHKDVYYSKSNDGGGSIF